MTLSEGFHDVPKGMVAAVVTHLDMSRPPEAAQACDVPGLRIDRNPDIDVAAYRALFRTVGEDWLWFSRLLLDDAALSRILHDPDVEVHVLSIDGQAQGFFELDFRDGPACELAFFGLCASAIGTGAGRAMMSAALRAAWARPIDRLHVHTCTFDHPGAVAFYRRSGFTVTRRQVEIAPDPRLSGALPRGAAPHVPIVD